jgi:hypothetical protein
MLRLPNHDPVFARHHRLPQSSSASRITADSFGFFILSQSGDRPELRRVLPLRHTCFAGIGENGRAVALQVFIEDGFHINRQLR